MGLTPGLQLPFGIQPINPVPVDSYSGPYTGATASDAISAANSAIPSALRFQSMMVRLIIGTSPSIYWYYGGTADNDLVEFSSGAGGVSSGVSAIYGTTDEIEVSANTGAVTVGLPNSVKISDSLLINGITIGSTGGTTIIIYGNLDVLGNINTIGNLNVDGFVMTKTAFLGFSGSASEEPMEFVSLDGGEY